MARHSTFFLLTALDGDNKRMSFQLEFGYLPPNVQSYARVTFGTGDSLFLGEKKIWHGCYHHLLRGLDSPTCLEIGMARHI